MFVLKFTLSSSVRATTQASPDECRREPLSTRLSSGGSTRSARGRTMGMAHGSLARRCGGERERGEQWEALEEQWEALEKSFASAEAAVEAAEDECKASRDAEAKAACALQHARLKVLQALTAAIEADLQSWQRQIDELQHKRDDICVFRHKVPS